MKELALSLELGIVLVWSSKLHFVLSSSLAATMAFFIIRGHPPDLCVKAGLLAAHLSLQSPDAIPITIDPENFTPENVEDCIQCEAKDIDCDIS